MIQNNKYREIKITYIHIITLIISFIAIGLLLFFLGYRIGKGSVEKDLQSENQQSMDKRIVKVADNIYTKKKKDTTISKKKKKKNNSLSEIDKELQMHNTIELSETKKTSQYKTSNEKAKIIKSKKIIRSTFYAIQIGAFRDHKGAKKEAQKFSRKYSTEIVKSGDLYKVRIGSFKSEKKARLEIRKNPKLKGCYTVKIKR